MIRTGLKGRPAKQYNSVNMLTNEQQVPKTVKEALASDNTDEWRAAMHEEYNALIKNDTWEIADLPPGQKAIGCRWVFAIKRDATGKIERYKARLVAKGCGQTYGVNYEETFSPVVRYATIRMVLAITAELELHVHQLDVSTAYLNGDLTEDIYMKQPEQFGLGNDRVLKLKKSLYGLKQSGRMWNLKLDEMLQRIGFTACASEPCLYTRIKGATTNIIAVYVDDLMVCCSDLGELKEIKRVISNTFQIVDKGPIHQFLGMSIERDGPTGAITISQKQHIWQLLEQYGMTNCRTTSVPLDPGFQPKCESQSCQLVDQMEYQSIIGSLMYIAISTRPDILHSVCKLSQRNTNPHVEHLAAAKQILRYLKTTLELKLKYQKTGQMVTGYVDADWGGDSTDRKSYSGHVFILGGSTFAWESKKQKSVALSSTEAEYMALSQSATEAVYIRKVLNEMNMYLNKKSIAIYGDNLSAMNLVKNPVYHARSKHIDIRYHYVREIYDENLIELKYCPTEDMVADLLTKNLCKVKHEKFTQLLGLHT